MTRKIRVMPEYECSPIWETGDCGLLNVPIEDLPVSTALKSDLENWRSTFESTYKPDYPPESGFQSEESLQEFDRLGQDLWKRLREELGNKYQVEYICLLDHSLLV